MLLWSAERTGFMVIFVNATPLALARCAKKPPEGGF
jgi:hypothetical protein